MRSPPSSPPISEFRFRQIWERQQFSSARLTTADGRAVHILSPGLPNADAGPDFLNAAIRIGSITFRKRFLTGRISDFLIRTGILCSPDFSGRVLKRN